MSESEYNVGDVVYAVCEILNDGSLPDYPEDALIAKKGAKGVVINEGHFEDFPDKNLYLVRFEGDDQVLGPPIGVWPKELAQTV